MQLYFLCARSDRLFNLNLLFINGFTCNQSNAPALNDFHLTCMRGVP